MVDQSFERHVLQVQYVDRLVGALLDKLRERGLFDDAVIVVSADHGVAFRTGEPRRAANDANIGEIAPVPLLVKYPGQRAGRVDDRSVRTIDVLPTIAAAAGVRLPWDADGIPAGQRTVDPDAPIGISHAGEHVLTTRLSTVLAKRRERELAETRLLRAGLYAMGPRPELIGRRVAVGSSARRPVESSFLNGQVQGVAPGGELAVAVNGVVEATTRAYRDSRGRIVFSALVPPESLRAGANAFALLRVLADGTLRPLAG